MIKTAAKFAFFLGLMMMSLAHTNGQCPDDNLDFISFDPIGANSSEGFTIILAKQYPDGCSGMQESRILLIDTVAKRIEVLFDQYCFDMDSMPCTQATHCDTAHLVLDPLPVGVYEIVVIDNNSGNHSCDSLTHETMLGGSQYIIRDIHLTGTFVYASSGSYQCLPFTVRGFDNLIDLQASFAWDSTKARYDTVRNLYPLAFLTPFNFNSPKGDNLRIIWLDNLIEGENIDDDATMFELCFEVTGNPGDTIVFDFDNGPLSNLATDSIGISYHLLTSNAGIIIDDNYYGTCDDDETILCMPWLKDTMIKRMGEYCNDSTIILDLVNWREYEVLRLTSLRSTNGTVIGMEEFFGCNGKNIGTCYIGGFSGGFCTNSLLKNDLAWQRTLWRCGDSLPGCYTTASSDLRTDDLLLEYNLVNDALMLKKEADRCRIISTDGKVLHYNVVDRQVNVGTLQAGVYYIQVGKSISRFVKVK